MEASAIRVDVSEVAKIERAVPQIAIVTATIKFTIKGNISSLEGSGMTREKREAKLSKILLKALQAIDLEE